MTGPRRRSASEDPGWGHHPLAGERWTIQTRLRGEIDSAASLLARAGIDSARHDAEELAAHLADTERGRLATLASPDDSFYDRYRDSIAARARRIPLQHLTGTAAFGPLTLSVGPGVFIPRPETEAMLEWATAQPLPRSATVVDLCTGSGALALALARHWPGARVVGVENSDEALRYARANAAGTGVELVSADVVAPGALGEFGGRVDLLVSNPPYVPDGARLEPEVLEHDPAQAVFGGPDGMAVIRPVVVLAARLLRPGGLFAVEHDDTTSASTIQLLCETGVFDDIVPRRDFTGRPRFVTARRVGVGP